MKNIIKKLIKEDPIGAAMVELYLYVMAFVFVGFIICEIVNYLQYGKL